MTARSRFAIVSTAVALFFFSNLAIAQNSPDARYVRLSMVDGDVMIQNASDTDFQKAFLNMPIGYAGKVWARDGAAEVELENGSTIRLTPQSQVTFEELSGDDSGNTVTMVSVQQGLVYFDIRPRPDDRIAVRFGQETVALRQRAEFRLSVGTDQFEVAVLSGEVQISSDAPMRVQVRNGETLAFDPQDESRYFLTQEVAKDSYDGWDTDRSQYRDKYAEAEVSNQNVPESNQSDTQNDQEQTPDSVSYVSTDLNYYGVYFNYVNYGVLWRPRYLPVNWDPYANGAWVFQPGIGYLWVSAYPWGWAPFHYGNWVFVPALGWCWHPGGHHHQRATWNAAVRLVNPPPGVKMATARPSTPSAPGKIISIGSGMAPQHGAVGFQQGLSRLPLHRATNPRSTPARNSAAQAQQSPSAAVSPKGGHVFRNDDPMFTPDQSASNGGTDAVAAPVEGFVVVQGPAQGQSPVQTNQNQRRWMSAATSPSNFSAATSPSSFSGATSSANTGATSNVTGATVGQGVTPVAVAPVFVPAQQGEQAPATENPQHRQQNTQPYPMYHTLPAVRSIPQQQQQAAPAQQQNTTVAKPQVTVPQWQSAQPSPATHNAANASDRATHQTNSGPDGGVNRTK